MNTLAFSFFSTKIWWYLVDVKGHVLFNKISVNKISQIGKLITSAKITYFISEKRKEK